jgi:hypothetical protein
VAIAAPHPLSCRCAECAAIRREDLQAARELRSWERSRARNAGGPQPGDVVIAVNARRASARIVRLPLVAA